MNRLEKCAIAYGVVALICFGPATVENEREIKAYVAECRAKKDALNCPVEISVFVGTIKAVAWPLWLSYKIADAVMEQKK